MDRGGVDSEKIMDSRASMEQVDRNGKPERRKSVGVFLRDRLGEL